uniref:(northern house mosquito) hypothetical protein n=1 Tax=Culex pipiens TaxID=7175 RepID=A0A8D8KLT0_CULPI
MKSKTSNNHKKKCIKSQVKRETRRKSTVPQSIDAFPKKHTPQTKKKRVNSSSSSRPNRHDRANRFPWGLESLPGQSSEEVVVLLLVLTERTHALVSSSSRRIHHYGWQ